MKSIVIFGAGIAGLSAAHELVQFGYSVSVCEATDQPGGFLRSSRLGKDNMPSEYSWHGMGLWYSSSSPSVQGDGTGKIGDSIMKTSQRLARLR